jgi:hypothetical protein
LVAVSEATGAAEPIFGSGMLADKAILAILSFGL